MRKIDKNKVYAFIGKVLVYGTLYLATIGFILWSFSRITVYK